MDIHWRNTQKPVRFFFLDARSFLAILFFMVYAKMWTLGLAIVVMFLFWFFERRGLTFESALRAFRSWILGTNRPATNRRMIRRWIDYT
jgi:intracellular multiplication protein IcmT